MKVTNNKTKEVKEYQTISDILNDEELNSTDDGYCADYNVDFTREEAIEELNMLQDSNEIDDDDEKIDYSKLSNRKLGEELCCSGCIHDANFGKVTGKK